MNNIVLSIAIVMLVFVSGCAGRAANPVAVKEAGDNKMSCEDIVSEMSDLDQRARRLMGEQSSKKGKNIAWGIAGLFLFPLWFGMDLSDAERQDAQAMQDRYRHLDRIYNKKDCEV